MNEFKKFWLDLVLAIGIIGLLILTQILWQINQ